MTELTIEADARPDTETAPGLGLLWAIGGVIGMISAAILIIEKIHLLEHPKQALSCDLNPFVSCGSVINTDQASVFGFPNPLIGVAAFPIVVMIGVLVFARVALPAFVWAGLQLGVVLGICFITWLQYQSIYEINALCPYCMVVWAATIPIFVTVTARNLRAFAPASALTRVVSNWTLLIVILWYVAVIAAIWFRFGTDLWA